MGLFLRDLFAQMPLWGARALFVAVPLILMVWVMRLSDADTTPEDRDCHWSEDLKVWAWLTLAMQVVIYCVL
jgi:hypothetical protein